MGSVSAMLASAVCYRTRQPPVDLRVACPGPDCSYPSIVTISPNNGPTSGQTDITINGVFARCRKRIQVRRRR